MLGQPYISWEVLNVVSANHQPDGPQLESIPGTPFVFHWETKVSPCEVRSLHIRGRGTMACIFWPTRMMPNVWVSISFLQWQDILLSLVGSWAIWTTFPCFGEVYLIHECSYMGLKWAWSSMFCVMLLAKNLVGLSISSWDGSLSQEGWEQLAWNPSVPALAKAISKVGPAPSTAPLKFWWKIGAGLALFLQNQNHPHSLLWTYHRYLCVALSLFPHTPKRLLGAPSSPVWHTQGLICRRLKQSS